MGKIVIYLCIIATLLCSAIQGKKRKVQHDTKDVHQEHGHHHDHKHQHNYSLEIQSAKTDFAFSLYKRIAAQTNSKPKNIIFSPLSISTALAMLSLGAKGKTHDELFQGLGFNKTHLTEAEVNEAFEQILRSLNQKTELDLSVGNAVFIRNNFKPLHKFLEDVKQYYHSEGFTVDFTNTTAALHLINKYVEEKTHGKVPHFIDDLSRDTLMFLVSYIYFRGKWVIPFDPMITRQNDFRIDEKTTVPVQMMINDDSFDVYHDKEFSTDVLRLNYKGGISLMLLLPEKGIEDLEESWCRRNLRKWHRSVKKQRYIVRVPKFSVKTSYSLQEVLSEMGMKDMFGQTANFSGLTKENVYVSKVVHKATLDVDELGTTATGVTGVKLVPFSLPPSLTFNRPFLFIISNHENNSIFFMGKIVNPAEK
ncbi:alpha-1-antitrypsin-like [Lepisosteus oculatus]